MKTPTTAIWAVSFFLLGVEALSAAHHESKGPPNILLIAIDDLKPIGSVFSEEPGDFLQRIYPDKALRTEVARRMTPNIQRLADQGVTFMNAYCAAPACNPSRAALMTGIRPHKSGLTTNANGIFFRDFEYDGVKYLADAVTMAEHLRHNGWYTASTGKIFHTRNSYERSDGPRSWTDWTQVTGGAGEKTDSIWRTPELPWGQEGPDNASFKLLNDYRAADFMARVLESGEAANGDYSFKLPEGKPFFLALGIFRPHLPFFATKDLIDLFPASEMTVTRELLGTYTGDGDDIPEFAFSWSGLKRDQARNPIIGSDRFTRILDHGLKVEPQNGDLKGWKDMLTHYFASCAIADRSVGRLLDGLENSDYKDNTLVILWSDHGYHLGEKLHITKFTLWDAGAKVNFFVKDPRHPQSAGIKCRQAVSLIDIYPTVMKAAGLEPPNQRITGHDLTPLLENPQLTWPIPAQSTFQDVANNLIRLGHHKLIQYQDGNRELYDLEADPEEFKNQAGKQTQSTTEARMQSLLHIAIEEGKFPGE